MLKRRTENAAFTVARLMSALDQVMTRPVSICPVASFVVAVSCTVDPIGTLVDAGEMMTVATGTGAAAVTVICACPVLPSDVAVMVAVPAPASLTNPVEDTLAMVLSLLDQVTTRPVSTLPLASRVAAVS